MDVLETPANHIENEAAGENGTGEQEEQQKETSSRNHTSSHPGCTKTHQNTLEHIKNTCSIMRGPTEALASQNCNTKSSTNHKGTPEPEPPEDYSHFRPQPQDHAHRNHQDFPVGLTPQPPMFVDGVFEHAL